MTCEAVVTKDCVIEDPKNRRVIRNHKNRKGTLSWMPSTFTSSTLVSALIVFLIIMQILSSHQRLQALMFNIRIHFKVENKIVHFNINQNVLKIWNDHCQPHAGC